MTTFTLPEPSSSSLDIELQAPATPYFQHNKRPPLSEEPRDRKGQSKLGLSDIDDIRQDAVPPDTAIEALQTWHSPRINMYRVFATFWSFFTVGMNDGSYGVCPISCEF